MPEPKEKPKELKIGKDSGRIREILAEFSDVLAPKLPKGLMPRRDVDH